MCNAIINLILIILADQRILTVFIEKIHFVLQPYSNLPIVMIDVNWSNIFLSNKWSVKNAIGIDIDLPHRTL